MKIVFSCISSFEKHGTHKYVEMEKQQYKHYTHTCTAQTNCTTELKKGKKSISYETQKKWL